MNIKEVVCGNESSIIQYVIDFYDPDLHGEEHWFSYMIKGTEIDVKAVYEDDVLGISAYSIDYGYSDDFVKLV